MAAPQKKPPTKPPPKERPQERPQEPAADWKRDAVAAFKAVAMRMVDREHTSSALVFMALLVLLVVAIRVPSEALGKAPGVVLELAKHESVFVSGLTLAVGVLLAACTILISALSLSRRIYRAEIDRMAEAKRELEQRLDPKRPATFAKSRIDTSRIDEEKRKTDEKRRAQEEAAAEQELEAPSTRRKARTS